MTRSLTTMTVSSGAVLAVVMMAGRQEAHVVEPVIETRTIEPGDSLVKALRDAKADQTILLRDGVYAAVELATSNCPRSRSEASRRQASFREVSHSSGSAG